MDTSEVFLMNIKQALSKLSKLRFATGINYEDYKSTYLNTWPLYYDDKNLDVMEYLKTKDIDQSNIPFIKVYEVPHSVYAKSKKIKGQEHLRTKIIFLRNYIEVRRIELNSIRNVKVSIAYDPNKTNPKDLPSNTDDYEGIQKTVKRSDVMFLFSSESMDWYAKVNAYVGLFIFSNMKLFPSQDIEHVSRCEVKSGKITRGDKANRFITHNPTYFKPVLELTEKNIKKAMKFESWASDLENVTRQYEERT